MNYYIQGDAANADKIKAAFEKLGYDTSFVQKLSASDSHILFTLPCDTRVHAFHTAYIEADILKRLVNIDPDYKELELPVEPKFKVHDWVVDGERVAIIYDLQKNGYVGHDVNRRDFVCRYSDESRLHIWTIADAKDGDVLFSLDSKQPFIYKERPQFSQARGYCCINKFGEFGVWNTSKCVICTDKYIPATKEQRDLLFKKMKEAGYQWDADKKELRKIKSHYDIKNFKPFDKVLIRVGNNSKWTCDFFSYYHNGCFHCVGTDYWSQCIPFNEDTKHLLGTSDPCDEQYINW